jgi:Ras GTPase-activating-like protein IQGAP2/3
MVEQRNTNAKLETWAVALQSMARGALIRRRWEEKLRLIKETSFTIIKVQAQSRSVLTRRRFADLKKAMKKSVISVVKLQSLARARIAKKSTTTLVKTFSTPIILTSIIAFQAHARGILARRRYDARLRLLHKYERSYTGLQAHCRGLLARRRVRSQLAKLENVADIVVRIQAAARTFLARRRLLLLIRGLRRATPALVGLQARARASLARQHHQNMSKALAEVKVIKSVGSFQAFARAAISRNRHREQAKQLDFVTPDVVGLQATVRGFMVRQDYQAWRAHLYRYQPVATILQAMLRGVLLRRGFRAKMNYYRENLDKVVKIQSLYRAKETREQYRQLTLGKNVNVGTIKNFVHLLDDSEADFKEELEVERLRKKVVESIRENQALENEVSDLDVKISLVVQNVKSFEDLLRIKRSNRTDAATIRRSSVLAAHGDPFAGSRTLDRTAKRKLELYQQLFYLLQTHPEYLSRLFECIGTKEAQEKNRRLTERVVLTLFGYGQDRREDFLLLKLFQVCSIRLYKIFPVLICSFQLAIQDEIADAKEPATIVQAHPMYITIAVHYLRPKQITYIRDALQGIIREVINASDLDLEVDPVRVRPFRFFFLQQELRPSIDTSRKDGS